MPELTGPQIAYPPTYSDKVPPISYKKLRRMRKDPTISLCRLMFFAGVYAGDWSYEGKDEDVDEEWIAFIKEQMEPMRRHILATGALGCFDFGWQPYEKIFDVDVVNTRIILRKLKPLLQDITTIQTDGTDNPEEGTGSFIGFDTNNVRLDLEKCLLLNFDVEGTNWEGTSTLGIAEMPYDSSNVLEDAVRKYDRKIAGAHWVIQYPDGKNMYGGVEYDNSEIADKILGALTASGSIAIPLGAAQFQDMVSGEPGWKIELITASGASVDFTNRYSYLDKLKCRALGFPERALLEGVHGTKAEAGAHQDFVITLIEYRHACLLEMINWHLVNQLLILNFGPEAENAVRIVASPLDDESYEMLATIYEKIISNPDGYLRESEQLNVQQIADTLGIPRTETDDDDLNELYKLVPDPTDPDPPVPAPAPEEGEEDIQVDKDTALNGAQIASALEIINQVAVGQLPRESGVQMLQTFFNLEPEVAEKLMGEVGQGFVPAASAT